MKWPIAIVVLSVLVAASRFMVPGHDLSPAGTVEAFQHIFVGTLLLIPFACVKFPEGFVPLFDSRLRVAAFWSLVAISVLELVMFLAH